MMTTTPTEAEILALWQACWPERLPHPQGLAQRLTNPTEFVWRRDDNGELVAFGAWRGPELRPYGYLRLLLVHPDHQRRGLGRELVTEMRSRLAALAPEMTLALGEEQGHFLSGASPASVPFWQQVGFEPTGAVNVDMRCDLRADLPPANLPGNFEIVTGEQDGVLDGEVLDGIAALIRQHFSPRWEADMWRVARLAPWQVLALRDLKSGGVLGFALVGLEDDPAILPSLLYPTAMRAGLDSGLRVGGLGPIGIAQQERGQGLGRAFMLAAMHHLRQRGAELMAIDWTGIAPFYEKLGFEPYFQSVHMRSVGGLQK